MPSALISTMPCRLTPPPTMPCAPPARLLIRPYHCLPTHPAAPTKPFGAVGMPMFLPTAAAPQAPTMGVGAGVGAGAGGLMASPAQPPAPAPAQAPPALTHAFPSPPAPAPAFPTASAATTPSVPDAGTGAAGVLLSHAVSSRPVMSRGSRRRWVYGQGAAGVGVCVVKGQQAQVCVWSRGSRRRWVC